MTAIVILKLYSWYPTACYHSYSLTFLYTRLYEYAPCFSWRIIQGTFCPLRVPKRAYREEDYYPLRRKRTSRRTHVFHQDPSSNPQQTQKPALACGIVKGLWAFYQYKLVLRLIFNTNLSTLYHVLCKAEHVRPLFYKWHFVR